MWYIKFLNKLWQITRYYYLLCGMAKCQMHCSMAMYQVHCVIANSQIMWDRIKTVKNKMHLKINGLN